MKWMLFLVIFLPVCSIGQVELIWNDSLEGDFSFVEDWDYPEGVFVNQWGQVSCDGLCPIEIDRMKDEKGRIYDDSLTSFYTYVDTTHLFHSFEGKVRAYEYGDCHYASASLVDGKLHIQTEANIATHSTLHIVLDLENESNPITRVYVLYNSIRNIPRKVYIALYGTIELSKEQLKNGIIQAKFDLGFQAEETEEGGWHHWEGKILTLID
jgi:hypothetical protein